MRQGLRNWKPQVSACFLMVLVSCVSLGAGQIPARGSLVVEISGVHPGKGTVRISIWHAAEGFLKGKSYRHAAVAATTEKVRTEIGDLEPGKYAVSAYQDENNNGMLDTGFLGKPKEPYGFSNDARKTFGPPSFDAAAFALSTGNKIISFRLK